MIKELQISLENCDLIKVDWKNVLSLSMTDVNKSYHFSKNCNVEMTVANNIRLIISKDTNLPHKEFGVGEFTTNFKRLYDCRDITFLTLFHDDGKEEEFYVNYEEDEFRCYNKLQSTELNQHGNLVITIGKLN